MSLRYAYNTNGLANHRLEDALRLLADIGYEGCALTLDHAHLDPFAPDLLAQVDRVGALAQRLGLALSLETGARYLLDARQKHEPTLVSSDAGARARRIDLLLRAVAIAADLGAEAVSLWSGVLRNGAGPGEAWSWLVAGAAEVARAAEEAGVTLGFEPEPGMLVERLDDYARLREAVGSSALRLTLDLGHALLVEDAPPEQVVRRAAGDLAAVHAEDMRRPHHLHLAFGEGEMRYGPILDALAEAGYGGLVGVELSRDSHRAPEVAEAALAYLRAAEAGVG
jgi:sugar phosphate isomerase/epimerase